MRFLQTTSMPFLSIVRIPRGETVSVTERPREGTQYRFFWTLTFQRRLVRVCEWDTDFPKRGRAPVT